MEIAMIPYTTIPFISAFFLIFVGVLIGHFVWYRYRDKQEHRTTAMRRKIDDLNSSLDIQTTEYTSANSRLAELEAAILSEQEQSCRLASELKEQETRHEATRSELQRAERVNIDLRDELKLVTQKRFEFEGQLQEVQDSLSVVETDRNATTDRITELTSEVEHRSKLAEEIQVDLEHLRAENVSLQQGIDKQAKELEQLNSEHQGKCQSIQANDRLRDDYKRVSGLLSEAQNESQVVHQQFESKSGKLLAELVSVKKENEVLQKVNADYVMQLESQMALTNDLSGKVSAALTDLSRFEQKAADACDLKAERERLINELEFSQNEMIRLTAELDSTRTVNQQAQAEIERLGVRSQEVEQEFAMLNACQQNSDAKLNEQDRRRESLERALAAASEELAQLQVERERLEGVEDEIVELDAKLRQALADLKLARTEREEALIAESSTREIVVTLRDELGDRLESLQALEEEKDLALATLEVEMENRQQIGDELQLRNSDCDRLADEVELIKQREIDRAEEATHVSQNLDQLQARYEQAIAEVKLYKQRLSDVETIRNAGREQPKRPSLFGQATTAKAAFSFRQVRRKEDVVRAEDKTKVRHDSRLGTVFVERPFRSDDLTQIRGISEKLNQELNALGIFTFKQVMEWDGVVTAEFARRLECDRIVEQDWGGQARRLYHLQYRAAA